MKKLFSVLLLLCLTLSAYSCANAPAAVESTTVDEVSTSETATQPELVSGLPDRDMGGYVFRVVGRDDSMHNYPLHSRDIIAEKEEGEPFNDAIYRRNKTLEEKYNFTIKYTSFLETSGEDQANKAVAKAVKAGDDQFDLLMTHMIMGGTDATAGYFLNWKNLPNIDLSKPWWCEGATTGLSVGNNLFLALSDFSISSNDHAYVMLFNKKLAKDFATENLYDLVNAGKWTLDKFQSVIKGISKDLNGDGKMDTDDLYGYIAGGGQLNYLYACGGTFTAKDDNNIPYIDYVTPHSTDIFAKVFEIFNKGDYTYSFTSWIDEKIPPMFSNDQGLILSTQVGLIPGFREMATDFGILPYPKWDEAQPKYLNYVDGHACLMAVPASVKDIDKASFIIEALSFESYKTVRPVYYDVALKTKFSRDTESAAMLDYVFDGRIFDFGYVYDNWISNFLFADLINTKKDTFVSSAEKKHNQSQKQLEKVLKTYEDLASQT